MPAPYTIQQTAKASGLSVKYIRRLREGLPTLFEKHSERGKSNALLFDEEIVEILKRMKQLKSKGRTLQQIRDELNALSKTERDAAQPPAKEPVEQPATEASTIADLERNSLKRENDLLRSQVTFLQGTLLRAEARFDRLLPEPKEKPKSTKSQVTLWILEAVVVTAVAAGAVGLLWFFTQGAIPA